MICRLIRWYKDLVEPVSDDDYLMTRMDEETFYPHSVEEGQTEQGLGTW